MPLYSIACTLLKDFAMKFPATLAECKLFTTEVDVQCPKIVEADERDGVIRFQLNGPQHNTIKIDNDLNVCLPPGENEVAITTTLKLL